MTSKPLRSATAIIAASMLLAGCQSMTMPDESIGPISSRQLVGGTTKQMRDGLQPVPGFLPNPALLEPGAEGALALVYRNPGVDVARYKGLILEPVAVWTSPTSAFAKVPRASRQEMANTFTSKLATAMKASCPMTTRAGPGVARLHFALVDATEPNAALNTLATYTPYVSTAYSAASYAFNKNVAYLAGTAQIEGYATNSKNGALLWEGVDKRGGSNVLVADTLDTRRDMNNAFDAWAKQLVTKLQALGVCRL